MHDKLNDLLNKLLVHEKLNLFCWCYPKRCHAETIKDYLERKIAIYEATCENLPEPINQTRDLKKGVK